MSYELVFSTFNSKLITLNLKLLILLDDNVGESSSISPL